MRVGIYGGTFNPIHTAHVHLVREFIKRLSLDRVILIPTGTPPHKATHQLASGADRIEMCRLAAADIAECPVTVSDIEVLRTGKSYTADTMTELKAQWLSKKKWAFGMIISGIIISYLASMTG